MFIMAMEFKSEQYPLVWGTQYKSERVNKQN